MVMLYIWRSELHHIIKGSNQRELKPNSIKPYKFWIQWCTKIETTKTKNKIIQTQTQKLELKLELELVVVEIKLRLIELNQLKSIQ